MEMSLTSRQRMTLPRGAMHRNDAATGSPCGSNLDPQGVLRGSRPAQSQSALSFLGDLEGVPPTRLAYGDIYPTGVSAII